MASGEKQEVSDMKNDEYCIVEASVVTGFEESARGEAREKFGVTDVKAARGKITWQVPLDRVKEVVKMGSVDNCRVVMYSVPHFKFTDQHDSLARLQQLVAEVDWDMGLRVWQQFFDFPHPIASRPDVIPSPEELIDVVIARNLPPKSTEGKKNKKGGRGKKKDKKRDKGKAKNEGKDAESRSEEDGNKEKSGDVKVGSELKASSENESKSGDDVHQISVNEKGDALTQDGVKDSASPLTSDLSSTRVPHEETKTEDSPSSASTVMEEKKADYSSEPKTVVVKRAQPGDPEPKIEIKVLMPGPDVFPTQVNDSDQRNVEPMDLDMSSLGLNQSVASPSKNSGDNELDTQKHTAETQDEKVKESNGESNKEHSESRNDADVLKEVSSVGSNLNSLSPNSAKETEFASSVIKKLTSPPASPLKLTESEGAVTPQGKACATPPPTPIANTDNPFSQIQDQLSAQLSPILKLGDGSDSKLDQMEDCADTTGSSVDPPCFSNKLDSKTTAIPTNDQNADVIPSSTTTVPFSSEGTLTSTAGNLSLLDSSPNTKPTCTEAKEAAADTAPNVKKERDPTKPTFRVTCNRVGDCHPFDSSSAAASFGSAVITYFNWSVDLKNFDIEVLLNIDNEEVIVSLGLTKTSLHNRNLVAFGPTTLRATICYNMLRLCRIKNGDFICDPMCGTSAIPIESALNWKNCYHFGGDFHEKAIERSALNIAAIQEKMKEEKKSSLKIDAVQWNIEHFPLRDKCVDVFVSDLPFGHRMGSRTVNRTLYPCLLSEMARTARSGARACLLTEDKTSLIKAIQSMSKYWQRRLILSINIGGLSGFVFLLTRTTSAVAPSMASWRPESATKVDDTPGNSEHTEGNEKKVESSSANSDEVTQLTTTTSCEVPSNGGQGTESSSAEGEVSSASPVKLEAIEGQAE